MALDILQFISEMKKEEEKQRMFNNNRVSASQCSWGNPIL